MSRKCDCGKVATTLAVFSIKITPVSGKEDKRRKRNAALALCAECTEEAKELDRIALINDKDASVFIYYDIKDVLSYAEGARTRKNKATKTHTRGRWTEILAWMAERERVTSDEIMSRFNIKKRSVVTSWLWSAEKRGLVSIEERHYTSDGNYYRVVKQPAG